MLLHPEHHITDVSEVCPHVADVMEVESLAVSIVSLHHHLMIHAEPQ